MYKCYLPFYDMTTKTDIKKRFFDSLKRGTGEANLIAKDNPVIDFSSYVIKGALRNYAYDGQSEPSRAQYIFDLYSLSDKKDKIRNAIIHGLATEQEDTLQNESEHSLRLAETGKGTIPYLILSM